MWKILPPPHDETSYVFHLYNGTSLYNPYCKIEVYPLSVYLLFTFLVSGLPSSYVNRSVGSSRTAENDVTHKIKKGACFPCCGVRFDNTREICKDYL